MTSSSVIEPKSLFNSQTPAQACPSEKSTTELSPAASKQAANSNEESRQVAKPSERIRSGVLIF